MNLQELKNKLEELKLPKIFYSLEGGLKDCTYCIHKTEYVWEVYYTERGKKEDLKAFGSEQEACDYFFDWYIKSMKYMSEYKKMLEDQGL